MQKTNPKFFKTPLAFRDWLAKYHARADELWVGFYKRGTGKPSITWPESVEAALCYGWIDGVRKSLDSERYVIRFTPRRSGSTWSAINIKTAQRLMAEKRMHPAGLAAFRARRLAEPPPYSYENRFGSLAPTYEKEFRRNRAAWQYFESRPPWYRRTCIHWVMSAKKEETRRRRLTTLISDCENQRPISPMMQTRKSK